MNTAFRPVSVPLITADPYFSVWSFGDRLTDDVTRHWTGHPHSLFGALLIDGKPYRFMGKAQVSDSYFAEGEALEQTGLTVTPTSTVYTFTHPVCDLKLTFLTPLLADRPEVFSRPVSYLFYEIREKEAGHKTEVYVDASAQLCGDDRGQEMICRKEPGHVSVGAAEQKVLNRCGDDVRIDWGYLHLVHPNAGVAPIARRLSMFSKRFNRRALDVDLTKPVPYSVMPVLTAVSDKRQDVFVLAYDDVKSIEYYHQPVDAYYKTVYGDFDTMLATAVREADALRTECAAFDCFLTAKMERISPEYARIGALVYRQTIAAHKLVAVDGKMMFLSKECFSNGCLATLDVTYPSIPLFLLLNPELVRGMMRPIFAYARTELWPFRFAPHDCGCYPFCNGQVYSTKDGAVVEDYQMPVEECGNAILCVAAALRADGDRSLAEENHDLLKQWADYLVEFGYDPASQLCTDDFAGHLAHNCNLSLKAITALGAYARMYGEEMYADAAKDMAARWVKDAKRKNGKGWRLTFDREDTWSMKYNIIWDRLLGLNLFDPSVCEEEIDVYLEKMNRYGVPLDSRADYTKLDWMAWTTVMADRPDYTKAVYEAIARAISESVDRVPVTDWYDTKDARKVGFQARSVLGGFFINLVAETF